MARFVEIIIFFFLDLFFSLFDSEIQKLNILFFFLLGDRIGLFTSPVNPDYMAPINCHQRLSDLIQDVADRTLYFQKLDMTLDELMTMIRICSR